MEPDEDWVADFEAFCEHGLKRVLRPYQVEPARAVIRSVLHRQARTIALLMARQSGKNELATCLALWMLLRMPGIKIGLYAPTLTQVRDISMRRLARHRKRLQATARAAGGGTPELLSLKELKLGPLSLPRAELDRQDLLELAPDPKKDTPFAERNEGSLLGAHSAEKEAVKEGFTWDLILYDEAQDIDRDVIDEEISPMGAATGATEVFIGTPYSVDCKFYDVIQAIKGRQLAGKCFEYPFGVVARLVPEYRRFVKKKAAELGRDSIAFRTQYALEWVEGLGMFFDFDVFRTLALAEEEFLSCMPMEGSRGEVCRESRAQSAVACFAVGIDLAGDDPGRSGRTDYTAIAVVRLEGERKTLVDLHAWRGRDWERQHQEIVRILSALPGRVQVVVDATGIGDSFSDRLQKALPSQRFVLERLKMTAESKSAVGLFADQEIAGGRVFYAAGPQTRAAGKLEEFLTEVRWLSREALPNKAIRWYVSPQKGHDDLVCAFFLALWASRRSPVARDCHDDLYLTDTAPPLGA